MESAPPLAELVQRAEGLFAERFGHAARYVVAAPGRVNLIGEHTDYNGGFVLPMAIERYVVIAAGRPAGALPGGGSAAGGVTAYSDLMGQTRTFSVTGGGPSDLPRWCVFPHGVLDLLHRRGIVLGPIEMAIVSTVPQGGGLSSSAALEVATATLAEAVTGRPLDGREKAKLCQQAENEYAGVPCGIMDQFASALCVEGEAMRLDCRSLEITPVPLTDPAVTVLVTNSNVVHELGSSEYPVRRATCESAAEKLGVASLRDVTRPQLLAAADRLTATELARARHVVTANERAACFLAAAASGDWAAAGAQMSASHASLRDDYQVSCAEVDTLVAIAEEIGPGGGVYGSRITGGGFGGCTVTLARADHAGRIAQRLLDGYRQQTGIEATAFTTRPARGAHVVRE